MDEGKWNRLPGQKRETEAFDYDEKIFRKNVMLCLSGYRLRRRRFSYFFLSLNVLWWHSVSLPF